jgi:hypothetical protein
VATGVVAALALIGYVLSRVVGLPQIGDDVGNWGDPLAIVAISFESLMLAAALLQPMAPTIVAGATATDTSPTKLTLRA